jgi:hypothetical protein
MCHNLATENGIFIVSHSMVAPFAIENTQQDSFCLFQNKHETNVNENHKTKEKFATIYFQVWRNKSCKALLGNILYPLFGHFEYALQV